MSENYRKSLIQHCKWIWWACGQTVLPERSILGQKIVENTEIEQFKWDILGAYSNSV